MRDCWKGAEVLPGEYQSAPHSGRTVVANEVCENLGFNALSISSIFEKVSSRIQKSDGTLIETLSFAS
jgi:hypothetical protein